MVSRKRSFASLGLSLLISTCSAPVVVNPIPAHTSTPTLNQNQPQAVIGMQNLTLEPSKNAPLSPNATVAPPPIDETEVQSLGERLADLKAKALKQAPTGLAGWYLFRTTELDQYDPQAKRPSPGIPEQYTQELWVNVDSAGLVIQGVTLMKTLDGKVFQSGVYSNGYSWNSLTGEKRAFSAYPLAKLLTGSHEAIEKNAKLSPVSVQGLEQAGKKLAVFTLTEKFLEPMKMEGLIQKVVQIDQVTYFSIETGLYEKEESVSTFEDGTRRIVLTNTQVFFGSMPQLSEEAAKLLNAVK